MKVPLIDQALRNVSGNTPAAQALATLAVAEQLCLHNIILLATEPNAPSALGQMAYQALTDPDIAATLGIEQP